MAKKEQWLIDRENRIKTEKAAMAALTPKQLDALITAHSALYGFVSEWSDGFDLYDIDTPRHIILAFRKFEDCFHFGDDDV